MTIPRLTSLCLGLAMTAALAAPAFADGNIEYPAHTPFFPSRLTRRIVHLPPYAHPFRVRIYAVPQQQPYYNVPPYGVITPY